MTSPHVNTNLRVDKNFSIKFTLFRDRFARFKQEREATLSELAAAIGRNKAPSKDQLPLVKLATFGDMASSRGSLRWDNNIQTITGVELDYDGGKISFDDARLMLIDNDIASIIYTTPSHTEEHPRWRVLAPCSCLMKPDERARMLARLNGVMRGAAHAESFTLSQAYYYGYVTDPPRVDVIEGTTINLKNDLDADAIGKTGKKSTNGAGPGGEWTGMEELLRRIGSGESLHPSVAVIAGKCAATGTPKEFCVAIVAREFERANVDRYTDRRWNDDVIRTIDDIYSREEEKHTQENTGDLPPDITLDDFYAFLPKHLYLYVPTQTLWPAATISSRLSKIQQLKATRWLDRNRAISQMIWAPGKPQIVNNEHLVEGGWIGKPGAIVYNTYREPPANGGDPAQAEPWLDLLRFLYPRPMEHEHIIRVLAFKLQHPEIKINHALVFGGGMRIGKDTLLVPIRRAFGTWNSREAKPIEIMGNFNPYMRSVILIINESRDLGDIKRYQFYDHMKDIIVSPPEVVPLNDKHEKTTHVLNVCLVIMTTNYRTDGLYLPPDDGRHFPVWSEVVEEDYEPGFFRKHYAWLNGRGGHNHVAAYLRSIDVGSFDPGEHPPRTEMFREIVDTSIPAEVTWIQDVMADSNWRPKVFILQSLVDRSMGNEELKKWLENPGNRKVIAHRLEACGYIRVRNPRHNEGRWKVGDKFQTVFGDKLLKMETLIREAGQLR